MIYFNKNTWPILKMQNKKEIQIVYFKIINSLFYIIIAFYWRKYPIRILDIKCSYMLWWFQNPYFMIRSMFIMSLCLDLYYWILQDSWA